MPYTPAPTLGEDARPNAIQPVATGGIAAQNELYTLYERPIPEQFDLFARHIQHTGFATMLRAMGFTRQTSTPTVGHFEEPWLHEKITVGSVDTAAVNPGDSAIIVLDSGDMYDTGATISSASRQASYPVVGDVVAITDTIQAQVTAKDTSVTPHKITLTPLDATDDISGATVAAADEYAILYNLWAEASGLPAGRVPRIIKYTNTLGVVKHSFGATGFELTNSVYHEVIPGQPGSRGQSIYVKIKRDDLIRFEHSKSNFLMFGQQVDNITATGTDTALGTDVALQGTEGFITFARTNGFQDTYAVGSYDITNFDTAAAHLLDERAAATNDVMGWLGPDIFAEIENSFTNTLTQNLIYTVDRLVNGYKDYMNGQYHQQLTEDDTDATLSFGYNAIRKNGFNFHMKRLSEFHDTRRMGADSYEYKNWALWHPVSWTTDQLSGASRSTIGYEYKGLGNYSRESIFGHLPGAGVGGDNTPYGRAVTEYDTMKYFLMSHCGFHGATGNALVVQRPA